MLSFSTLFIFMLMALALPVRRYYVIVVMPKCDFFKFIVCLVVIFGSSIGITTLWGSNSYGWIGISWFLICSAIMIIYHLLVGAHATYDTSHQELPEAKVQEGKGVQEASQFQC
ncbi:hypothetical protein M9H77_21533 [Catharanthus roseus]|uniref:Uncharacterized protein n=1 Tax=Catharanthus roseus TaxID=4058 RepID=A0ACC0APN3_CATRO|nr:hypothetical protein M9H77_21533 [Catharanthus roseus]